MSELDDIKKYTGEYYKWALEARKKYLLLLQQTDETIAEIYIASIKRIIKEFKNGNKNIKHLLEVISDDAEQFNYDLAKAIKTAIEDGATAGVYFNKQIATDVLKKAGIDVVPIIKSIEFSRKRAVQISFARSYKDGLKVSERIWNVSMHTRKVMSDIVRAGTGEDVNTVAKALEGYVQHGKNDIASKHKNMMKRMKSRVPVNLNYNALRLARTELTAAYGEGVIASAKVTPNITRIKWSISGTHPRIDICDSYAKGGKNGDGVYEPENTPPYPAHPNCLCTLVPESEDTTKLVGRLKEWLNNSSTHPDLEKWYQEHYKMFM